MSRRALQVVLTLLGIVAVVFGSLSLVGGASLVLDGGAVSAGIDSELRFYAAWYAATGIFVLRTVSRVESETRIIRAVCAVLFVAGCARLLSLAAVGRPHAVFLGLTVIELALPIVVVPWQAAVARRSP